MNLLAISINHKTAPVELREALHLTKDEISFFLNELTSSIFHESFIISTCNRTEIFGIPRAHNIGYMELLKFLLDKKSVNNITEDNFHKYFSCSAINHLFKVVAGIDSQMIGDNQIFGQVKEAFQIAEENKKVGFLLKRLFDAAIQLGKRVKTETLINDGAVTVSYAAVQLIEKIFSNLSKKNALVIGAGETGEIAAKHLRDKDIGRLAITNRTYEKAEKIAEELNAGILPFSHFKENLHEFDIIISSTSAPELILLKDDVKLMMKKRHYQATVFMDIAVPRDIDSSIKSIDNVFYNDIDSLNIIVEQNLIRRKEEIPKVQKIIIEEMVNFYNWFNSLEIAPTIKMLRDYFEEIRNEEVQKQINKFSSDDKDKVEILTRRIINKILHQPTIELKKSAELGIESIETMTKIAIIKELFKNEKND
jgi:glutamyl-tRNA reductase